MNKLSTRRTPGTRCTPGTRHTRSGRTTLLTFGATSLALAARPLIVHAADATDRAAAEAKPGLLDLNVGSIVWVLVIFVILVLILYRTAWKNVLAGLKAREQRIRNDIAQAEAARLKAEETLALYNKQVADAEARVREMLDQARVDAEQIANNVRTRAQQDAEAIREKAEQDIERAKNDAIAQIYEQAATLATDVAEKILRRSLNPDDQRDLVNRSLEQLQSIRSNGNN